VVVDGHQVGLGSSLVPSAVQGLAVHGHHRPAFGDRLVGHRGGPVAVRRAFTHRVNAASSAVTSRAASTRRIVDSDGGGPQMATGWSATAAHSAIAVQERAPVMTAPSASSRTDRRL